MVCMHEKWVCNICVCFGDVRQFSSSQKLVQKQSLTEFKVARCATNRVPKRGKLKSLKLIHWAWKFAHARGNKTKNRKGDLFAESPCPFTPILFFDGISQRWLTATIPRLKGLHPSLRLVMQSSIVAYTIFNLLSNADFVRIAAG